MKAKLHPMFEQVSGQMGEMVYRVVNGKVVVSRKPDMNGYEPTPPQVAHRERFKQAAAFGRTVLANGELRPLYEAAAKDKNMPIFALLVADFFNAPTIHNVDVFGYSGNIGDVITVNASDDFGVEKVLVSISDDQGNPIENGEAVETAEGSGEWNYTATAQGQPTVKIQVVALDHPGGTAIMNIDKTF
jgi:hypothetical protein